jgi:sigma-E factor negative regulatory protein RseA
MSKETLEHLSALMDGELSRETSLFVTRRLSTDEALGASWERYHLIRDCIRQPGSKQVVTGLQDRISSALAADAAPVSRGLGKARWLKPLSGLAIAASVAVMAIMVTAPQQGAIPVSPEAAPAAAATQPFVSPNALPIAPVSQTVSYESADQLNVYLLRHNQVARTAGRQGFVSFVPIVATPVEAVEDDETGQASADDSPEGSETP